MTRKYRDTRQAGLGPEEPVLDGNGDPADMGDDPGVLLRSEETVPLPNPEPQPVNFAQEQRIGELRGWWESIGAADFESMVPKIGEYTAADLEIMGTTMERWLALPAGSGAEAACLWYVLGKVARAVAAYREGRVPSIDTLHDIRVYAMMAQRIRETGGWP